MLGLGLAHTLTMCHAAACCELVYRLFSVMCATKKICITQGKYFALLKCPKKCGGNGNYKIAVLIFMSSRV